MLLFHSYYSHLENLGKQSKGCEKGLEEENEEDKGKKSARVRVYLKKK